uniref:Uncharacterized protein n=1 Tax=Mola mola TaxID=94237 RepID=A0A3Q3X5B7_MOLML
MFKPACLVCCCRKPTHIPAFTTLEHLVSQLLSAPSSDSQYVCVDTIAEMSVVVYYTSVTGSLEQHISFVLDCKKIDYKMVDISQSTEEKDKMREMVGDPKALPPQIFNGNTYCGDYTAFEEAIEMEELEKFLKL